MIETPGAFYVIQVEGKEVQPVEQKARDMVVKQALAQRLTDTRTAIGSHPALLSGQVRRILQSLPPPPISDAGPRTGRPGPARLPIAPPARWWQ